MRNKDLDAISWGWTGAWVGESARKRERIGPVTGEAPSEDGLRSGCRARLRRQCVRLRVSDGSGAIGQLFSQLKQALQSGNLSTAQ